MILPLKNTIGIYKITSPTNKIYIGQSVCVKSRWELYLNKHCKSQSKLYRSLNKHGVENHKFEIVTECLESELNELERYYQEVYNVLDRECGLNLRYTASNDRVGKLSDEHKENISKGIKKSELFKKVAIEKGLKSRGVKRSKEVRDKLSKAFKGRFLGSKNPAARRIKIKNLNTLQEFKGSMECVAKFLHTNVEYVWNRVDERTKKCLIHRDWVFMDEDKHDDYLDIKGDIYLDLHTGIYHFDDEFMDIRTRIYKSDSLNSRLRYNKRYKRV